MFESLTFLLIFPLLALYRMSGFSIYAFYDDTFDPQSPSPDDLVYHHDPMSECPAPIQNITINRLVRQIVFTNQRLLGFQSACSGQKSNLLTSIEICEINVMGKFFKISEIQSIEKKHYFKITNSDRITKPVNKNSINNKLMSP